MVFRQPICYACLMNSKNLVILLISLIILSCTSVEDSPAAADGTLEPDIGTDSAAPSLPDGWIYKVEITNEGTRSEGSIGRLFYRYNELPPVFSRVTMEDKSFIYHTMTALWDDSGYIPSAETFVYPLSAIAIERRELDRGWYMAEGGRMKTGTPAGWVVAESEGSIYCAAPDKLASLSQTLGLNEPPAGIQIIE